MEYDALKIITQTAEWVAVEQTLEAYLNEMFDLRKVDTTLPAEDYKIECVARLRAAENVYNFYKTNKFISKKFNEVQGTFR